MAHQFFAAIKVEEQVKLWTQEWNEVLVPLHNVISYQLQHEEYLFQLPDHPGRIQLVSGWVSSYIKKGTGLKNKIKGFIYKNTQNLPPKSHQYLEKHLTETSKYFENDLLLYLEKGDQPTISVIMEFLKQHEAERAAQTLQQGNCM